ncbi:MAG: SPFH domain-containing protein [Planctomycetota bacterium]|nr:SPFH domain-containing protein [Planctomycetota bacterium]
MNRMPRGLMVIFFLVVLVPLIFGLLFERIHPMEIGVRQIRWGSGGIEQGDFPAGFHLGVGGYHKWYRLPKQTHFLHYSASSREHRDSGVTVWQPALELRTRDNNTTTLDVTVPYRIKAGEGWKIVARGLRQSYRSRVESTVVSVLREELSQLSSEDLQLTSVRLERIELVLPLLNAKLADFFVEAETILIRRVSFLPEYEEKLQEKQYFTQKAELDAALAAQANEEQRTNTIEKEIEAAEKKLTADWDKKLQEETSKYEVLIAEIDAGARVYEARVKADAEAEAVALEAQGQLDVDKARALRDVLRNDILNSRGGDIYLALIAAEKMRISSITLNSNDPRVPIILDLDAMAELLVGSPSDADE